MPSGNSHGVGFPRLQHWTKNGVNMLAGLRPLIVKNTFYFVFIATWWVLGVVLVLQG